MPCAYILYSPSKDSYYYGATTLSAEERLHKHLNDYYDEKYTASIKDWQIFLEIGCSSMKQAMSIEKHIKSMKSRKYVQNLKLHPEMIGKLLEKFHEPDS